jgi:hypothetical protein
VGFAVGTERGTTVLLEVEAVPEHDFPWRKGFRDAGFCRKCIQPKHHVVDELNEDNLWHLFVWESVDARSPGRVPLPRSC